MPEVVTRSCSSVESLAPVRHGREFAQLDVGFALAEESELVADWKLGPGLGRPSVAHGAACQAVPWASMASVAAPAVAGRGLVAAAGCTGSSAEPQQHFALVSW